MRAWRLGATARMCFATGTGGFAARTHATRSALDERTSTFGHRTKCLIGRDRGAQLVVIPRALGLLGFLYLEQVHWVDLAAVCANLALTEKLVVGWRRFHFFNDRLAVGVALESLDCLQIVEDRRIHAGMHHRGVDALEL